MNHRFFLSLTFVLVGLPVTGFATLNPGFAVLAENHMDIRISAELDYGDPITAAWDLYLHHDDEGEFDFDDALLYLRAPGEEGSPGGRVVRGGYLDDPQFDFIGAASGETFYQFPQSQLPLLLWPGANTGDIESGTFSTYFEEDPRVNSEGDHIRLDLMAVRGPGEFSIFNEGDGQVTLWMATSDGIDDTDSFFLIGGDHRHFNWAFTAPGIYEVDLRASALVDDGSGELVRLYSGIETLHIGVEAVPEPASAALLLLGLAALGTHRRRQ